MEANPEEQFYQLIRKADLFLGNERADLAEIELQQALALRPQDGTALFMMASVLVMCERYGQAKEMAQQALSSNSSYAPLHQIYGLARMHLGENQAAEKALIESLRLDPSDPDAYRLYAVLLGKTGHKDKARRLCLKGLELAPNDAALHGQLSLYQASLKDRQGAKRSSALATSLAPDNDYVHFTRGVELLQDGHPFKARAALRECLRLDPMDTDYQAAFVIADKCCRVIYLPMYWVTRVMKRVPGGWLALWATVFLLISVVPESIGTQSWFLMFLYGYLGLCVYSWIADYLVSAWVKLLPPKF